MIHHVLFCKLAPEIDGAQLEDMVRTSRSLLLKIPEVLSVRSGRNLDPDSDWPFFVAIEFESTTKKRTCEADPVFLKFQKEVLTHAEKVFDMTFETDPSKSLKYS
ncbi:MAG: Dabb family protein [Verrucomicrobiota bacterium]